MIPFGYLVSIRKHWDFPPHLGRCEKIGFRPLTLPSPRGGEGKQAEINNKFPPP